MNAARSQHVTVIGGGIAGCAAALGAARVGAPVTVYEQRPTYTSPLYSSDLLAELTGSVDLGAAGLEKAAGLLRAELARLSGPLADCGEQTRTGQIDLTVDRQAFARAVTQLISEHPGIEVRRESVETLPADGPVVVATGPATWSPLAQDIYEAAGHAYRFAWWGRAPLVAGEALDAEPAVWAPQYPGAEQSLFIPLAEDEIAEVVERLSTGERVSVPGIPEGILGDETPLAEELAASDVGRLRGRVLATPRGDDSVQAPGALRLVPDDAERTRYALAGVATTLTAEAQAHVLAAVAGLAGTELVRPGMVHRLPCVPAEALLPTLQLQRTPSVFIAGILAGGMGYTEAMATGLMAGVGAALEALGEEPRRAPWETLTGHLCRALTEAPTAPNGLVQANFGLLPEAPEGDDNTKEARRQRQAERALTAMEEFAAQLPSI